MNVNDIARIICPEAWDRIAYRRMLKDMHGDIKGIDVELSMRELRDACRQKAIQILTLVHLAASQKKELGNGKAAKAEAEG